MQAASRFGRDFAVADGHRTSPPVTGARARVAITSFSSQRGDHVHLFSVAFHDLQRRILGLVARHGYQHRLVQAAVVSGTPPTY
jgi:hypothetical protein